MTYHHLPRHRAASGTTASSCPDRAPAEAVQGWTPRPSSTPATSATSSSSAPATANAEVDSLSRWPGAATTSTRPTWAAPLRLSRTLPATPSRRPSDKYTSALRPGHDDGRQPDRQRRPALRQAERREPGHARPRANPIFPDILPAVTYAGGDAGLRAGTTITPRLGLTYALGAERKTLLRASYSRFADQLGTGGTVRLNPLTLSSYAYFYTRTSTARQRRHRQHRRPQRRRQVRPQRRSRLQRQRRPEHGWVCCSRTRVDSEPRRPITDELLLERRARSAAGVRGRREPHLPPDHRHRSRTTSWSSTASAYGCFQPEQPRPVSPPQSDYVPVTTTTEPPAPGRHRLHLHLYKLKPGVTTRGGVFLKNGDRASRSTRARP